MKYRPIQHGKSVYAFLPLDGEDSPLSANEVPQPPTFFQTSFFLRSGLTTPLFLMSPLQSISGRITSQLFIYVAFAKFIHHCLLCPFIMLHHSWYMRIDLNFQVRILLLTFEKCTRVKSPGSHVLDSPLTSSCNATDLWFCVHYLYGSCVSAIHGYCVYLGKFVITNLKQNICSYYYFLPCDLMSSFIS